MITLSLNEQNSYLARTYTTLVALSHPSNVFVFCPICKVLILLDATQLD